jgi:hypothetical protein
LLFQIHPTSAIALALQPANCPPNRYLDSPPPQLQLLTPTRKSRDLLRRFKTLRHQPTAAATAATAAATAHNPKKPQLTSRALV